MTDTFDADDYVKRERYEPDGEAPKQKRSKPILRLPTPYSGKPTPPRRWLFGQHYIRGFVSGTFAPGARGKSSHVLLDSVAMATGYHDIAQQRGVPRNFRTQREPLRVWYVNAEDPLEESERRVEAILKHYGLKFSDLGGRLHLDSGREHDCVFVRDQKSGVIATPVVEGVIEGIHARKIDVTALDPIVAFHRVPENDNGKMDAVLQEMKDIADWTNTSVEIVGHTRKTNGEEVNIDDVRAASAIVNAARNLRLLNGMTPQEAEKYGVNERERRSYYRFDEGKPNLKKPGGLSTWMKMESVLLNSGEEVGVPESWTVPRAEDGSDVDPIIAEANAPLEPLSDSDLAVLSLITTRLKQFRPVVCGARSDDSAPKLFSKGVRGGKQRKARAEAVEASVDKLIAHGKLHTDIGLNGGHARLELFLGPRPDPVADDDQRPRGPRPWDKLEPVSEPAAEV
jgi:AAA domain-containing protein